MGEKRMGRMAAPDVLRVASILIVGWFHIWQQSWLDPGFHIGSFYVNLQQIIRHGYMMVDEMLLLSGFLLALPAARQAEAEVLVRPADFYRRRFWRIAPGYYLCVILTTLFYALPRGLYHSTGFMVKDLVMHFTFTHTLAFDTYMLSPTAATIWTLSVEVMFYVLWPAIARFYVKRPGETCLSLVVIALFFRSWVATKSDSSFLFNQLPAQLDLYACGMGAAWVLAGLERKGLPSAKARRIIAPAGMLLCFGGMLAIMYKQNPPDYEALRHGQMFWRLPLGLLGGCFLLCGCLAPERMERALDNPVTRVLSDASYSFYIWHQFLACRLKEWRIPPYLAAENPNMAYEQPWQTRYTLVCFLGVAALSILLTYAWEKPLQKWGLQRLRARDETS